MTPTPADLSTDHSRATLAGAHSHGGPRYVSSRADRPTSFDPADIPVPTGREEEWRFTPLRRFAPLLQLDTLVADDAPSSPLTVTADVPSGATVASRAPTASISASTPISFSALPAKTG